jgi:hypothetical protein
MKSVRYVRKIGMGSYKKGTAGKARKAMGWLYSISFCKIVGM